VSDIGDVRSLEELAAMNLDRKMQRVFEPIQRRSFTVLPDGLLDLAAD
jgi:hypothetical protein